MKLQQTITDKMYKQCNLYVNLYDRCKTHVNISQVKSCTAMHVPYVKIYYVDKKSYSA